jgi:hypothetical protein
VKAAEGRVRRARHRSSTGVRAGVGTVNTKIW